MVAWALLACSGPMMIGDVDPGGNTPPAAADTDDTDAEPAPPIWIADAYASCEDDGRTKVRVYVDPDGVQFEATLYVIDTEDGSSTSEERTLTPGWSSGGHAGTLDLIGVYDTAWSCGQYERELTLVARVYELDEAGARTSAMDCLVFGDDPAGLLAGEYDLTPPPSAPEELAACRVLE